VTALAFDIFGNPAAQGSKRHVGGGRMVETAKGHAPWRSAVAAAAHAAAVDLGLTEPLDGALAVDVTFRFPMPASRSKRIREIGQHPKTTAPDLDKLARALLDGLQAGGLIVDDARVCVLRARKVEVVGWTGASVEVVGS
jgi:crossover junction endodeoxyribonuclease RusA